MLEFSGEYEMEQSREDIWPYFTDPDVLAECAPGCKEMVLESPHELTMTMAVGVGSVKPEFDVNAIVTRTEYPAVLEVKATGNASRNEFDMAAKMELEEIDGGGTTVYWEANADVSGTIVSLGGRALKSVTDRLVGNYFADMQEVIERGEGAESKLKAAPDSDAAEIDVDIDS